MKPTISVIIPTCHRNDLLAKCLDCFAPGLQTLPADQYEVIVTDDGSKSTARKMVREYYPWVTWVAGPRCGPAANRNNGARFAMGEWLAFTDDDCLPSLEWLSAFNLAAQGSDHVLEGRTITNKSDMGLFFTAPENLMGGYLWSCNMAVRHSFFSQLEGFDERIPYPHLEDVDFRKRLVDQGYGFKFVVDAVVMHPQRPICKIIKQVMAQESAFYMSKKYRCSVDCFGLSAISYPINQVRHVVKKAKSLPEAANFFITRSLVEGLMLAFLSIVWLYKYRWK